MADSNNDTDVMILDIILKLAYKVSNRNETAVEPIKREAKKAKEAVAAEEEAPNDETDDETGVEDVNEDTYDETEVEDVNEDTDDETGVEDVNKDTDDETG